MTGKADIGTGGKKNDCHSRKIVDVTPATLNQSEERYQALSQMARGIAHDFNNFLSLIQGFSDLLLSAPEILDDKATVRRYLSQINKAAGDASRIVRRLRQFYRPGGDERLEPVDVAALIEEAIALTRLKWEQPAALKGAPIIIENHLGHQSAVNGNRTELSEVMINLIFNAVEAMPQGGVLRFLTREEDSWIILEVTDTGVGMEAAVREQCLMPFYTTKGEFRRGLGLSTVQGIVTRHQGHIDIQSAPGRGTAFLISLPAVEMKAEQSVSNSRPLNPAAGLKILIVDDEASLLDMMAEFLGKDHHRVETAANGLEGIQKFNTGWFDLIITDLAMPGLDGYGLARHIKKISPSKPVILLTGLGDVMGSDDKKRLGLDGVISKPVSLARLRQIISQVMFEKKR